MKLFNKMQKRVDTFDFVKNSKKVILGSATILFIGLILFFAIGFNLGIDFTGGTTLKVQLGSDLENDEYYRQSTDEIEQILEDDYGLSLSVVQKEGEGSESSIMLRYQDLQDATKPEMESITSDLRDSLSSHFDIDLENVSEAERIGATASASLLLNALLAVLFATILMLIYIMIRFELVSGLGAILALIHDVGIMLSLVLVFQLEVTSAFVAALITIIGYSINDTIVVFDRVRENRNKNKYELKTNTEVANISIRETLVRTLNTSFTTLFTISVLAILTVPAIRQFAIPIIFGLIAGTLSSVFVATPFWAYINDYTRPRKKNADPFEDARKKKIANKRDSQ
ncbi:MAG: protein translocase subunit SecF [Halanaerobiales bacterium]